MKTTSLDEDGRRRDLFYLDKRDVTFDIHFIKAYEIDKKGGQTWKRHKLKKR